MSKQSVILADDHRIVAEGLKTLLEQEFDVLCIVENGRDLVQQAKSLRPDLIVADISMPELNGIDALVQIRDAQVSARVIFLTMHPEAVYAARSLEAGASGYVLKHAARRELLTAMREVLAGRIYVTPSVAEKLDKMDEGEPAGDAVTKLTSRQREVLQLIAEGRIAKQIASALNISPRTVEFHKGRLMKELGVDSTAELTQIAIRYGLISIK